jgi:hypothetical protein
VYVCTRARSCLARECVHLFPHEDVRARARTCPAVHRSRRSPVACLQVAATARSVSGASVKGAAHDTAAREVGVHLLQLLSVARRADKGQPSVAEAMAAETALWAPRGFTPMSPHADKAGRLLTEKAGPLQADVERSTVRATAGGCDALGLATVCRQRQHARR